MCQMRGNTKMCRPPPPGLQFDTCMPGARLAVFATLEAVAVKGTPLRTINRTSALASR